MELIDIVYLETKLSILIIAMSRYLAKLLSKLFDLFLHSVL